MSSAIRFISAKKFRGRKFGWRTSKVQFGSEERGSICLSRYRDKFYRAAREKKNKHYKTVGYLKMGKSNKQIKKVLEIIIWYLVNVGVIYLGEKPNL